MSDLIRHLINNRILGITSGGSPGDSGGGDYSVVATTIERDQLTPSEGSRAFVQANGMEYIYRDSAWIISLYGVHDPAVVELWVDPANGDDENIGDEDFPLATLQVAVYKLIPPHLPVPSWESGDDRIINVVANGIRVDLEAPTIIPHHEGLGVLYIRGEEEVVYADLMQEDGAGAAAVAGFYSKHTLEVSTSALDADEFALPNDDTEYAAFIRWTEATMLDGWTGYNYFDYADDKSIPIITNSADQLTVVAGQWNWWTMNSGQTDRRFDIVRPLIKFRWASANPTGDYEARWMFQASGRVMFEGFVFDAANGSLIRNTNSQTAGTGDPQRCPLRIARSYLLTKSQYIVGGSDCTAFMGCTMATRTNYSFLGAECNLFLSGVYVKHTAGERFYIGANNLTAYGLVLEVPDVIGGGGGGVGNSFTLGFVDIRPPGVSGGGLRFYYGLYYVLSNMSVEGAGTFGAAIQFVGVNKTGRLANVIGTVTGNYGFMLTEGARLDIVSGTTITGNLGDRKIGNLAVSAWNAGVEVDYEDTLCRAP